MDMPYHVVASVAKALRGHEKALNSSKALVLGLAYKKDIDDLRESPSLTIIAVPQRECAEVSYNDPYFPFVGQGRHYKLNMHCTPLDKISEFDCVVIVTDHSDYDYVTLVRESALVVDSRKCDEGHRRAKSGSLLRSQNNGQISHHPGPGLTCTSRICGVSN